MGATTWTKRSTKTGTFIDQRNGPSGRPLRAMTQIPTQMSFAQGRFCTSIPISYWLS